MAISRDEFQSAMTYEQRKAGWTRNQERFAAQEQAYKPDPRMFQHALKQFGLEPHEVLHVGDSEVDDVQGAKAAGLRVAWVNRDGRRRRPDVPQPDFEIADLTGLLRLL